MQEWLKSHSVVQVGQRGGDGNEKTVNEADIMRLNFMVFGCVMDKELEGWWPRDMEYGPSSPHI